MVDDERTRQGVGILIHRVRGQVAHAAMQERICLRLELYKNAVPAVALGDVFMTMLVPRPARLDHETGPQQIQKRLVANRKSIDHGVTERSMSWLNGRVQVGDQLKEFLVAADIEAVVTEDRFERNITEHSL